MLLLGTTASVENTKQEYIALEVYTTKNRYIEENLVKIQICIRVQPRPVLMETRDWRIPHPLSKMESSLTEVVLRCAISGPTTQCVTRGGPTVMLQQSATALATPLPTTVSLLLSYLPLMLNFNWGIV